jgi:hypothetical protein
MKHLITNLTVLVLNLTWLRESKQQHDKDMKHYMTYKIRHLITNLVVPELNLTCLREIKQQRHVLMEAMFLLTHATYSRSFGVI